VDKKGFTKFLQTFNLKGEAITNSIAISERFELFLKDKKPTAETVWDFSRLLIKEKKNDFRSYLALLFYCQFIKQDDMYIGFMELIDGGEVSQNLYKKVSKKFGEAIRDEVFKGTGIAPYGTPSPEKPAYLHPVLKRLDKKVGKQACNEFLSAGLRNMPTRDYMEGREPEKRRVFDTTGRLTAGRSLVLCPGNYRGSHQACTG
jgi:hypothetical protein